MSARRNAVSRATTLALVLLLCGNHAWVVSSEEIRTSSEEIRTRQSIGERHPDDEHPPRLGQHRPPNAANPALSFAQTHVMQYPATRWPDIQDDDMELHLVARRRALFMVDFGAASASVSNPTLVLSATGCDGATLPLLPPSALPPTYVPDRDDPTTDRGTPYSSTIHSVMVEAEHICTGLSATVRRDGAPDVVFADIPVGPPIHHVLLTFPMYLFGASEETVGTRADAPITRDGAMTMTPEETQRYLARLPVASFAHSVHPATFRTDCFVVGPSEEKPAYQACAPEDVHDHWKIIGGSLRLISALKDVDGRSRTATHYYGALVKARADGSYVGAGGGLGGGARGVGPAEYLSLFHHEMGHAFGLAHAGGEYERTPRSFPYEAGSWKGSAWAFDTTNGTFIDPWIHGAAARIKCTPERARVRDAATNLCYKQDPMQGGGWDNGPESIAPFTDYNAARIQRNLEKSGKIFETPDSGAGYARYDSASGEIVPVPAAELEQRFPPEELADVPLVAALFTLNCPELGCANVDGPLDTSAAAGSATTHVYPPMSYVGSTRGYVNATDREALDRTWPASYVRAEHGWCAKGCDFLARFLFDDGAEETVVVPHAFRPYTRPTDAVADTRLDPLHSASHLVLGAAVPSRGREVVEAWVLHAPRAWEGIHAREPQPLAGWTRSGGETRPSGDDTSPGAFAAPTPARRVDLLIHLPAGADRCSTRRDAEFYRAAERAVFGALVAAAGGGRLPGGSSVRVRCDCAGATCRETCASEFEFPRPERAVDVKISEEERLAERKEEFAEDWMNSDAEMTAEKEEVEDPSHAADGQRRRLLQEHDSRCARWGWRKKNPESCVGYVDPKCSKQRWRERNPERCVGYADPSAPPPVSSPTEAESTAPISATTPAPTSVTTYDPKCSKWWWRKKNPESCVGYVDPKCSKQQWRERNPERCVGYEDPSAPPPVSSPTEAESTAPISATTPAPTSVTTYDPKCSKWWWREKFPDRCSPPVEVSSVPVPQCGCAFDAALYNGAQQCGFGLYGRRELVKKHFAPGVFYYALSDGTPVSVSEAGHMSETSPPMTRGQTFEEAVETCRARADCVAVNTARGVGGDETDGYAPLKGVCVSPCYQPRRSAGDAHVVTYHIDGWENPWSSTLDGESAEGATTAEVEAGFVPMILSFDVRVPPAAAAAVKTSAAMKDTSGFSTAVAALLLADEDFVGAFPKGAAPAATSFEVLSFADVKASAALGGPATTSRGRASLHLPRNADTLFYGAGAVVVAVVAAASVFGKLGAATPSEVVDDGEAGDATYGSVSSSTHTGYQYSPPGPPTTRRRGLIV